ncbi:SHOCT domain-containing protein [Rhodococcus sp. Q]|uniref:SHOCT domain-containing protein n=1 Tax=Rhodococcus sp. Q TaxID=2502252 RepID=UPI0010F6699E|nr:SHOCT domain-containing protein [Rhodococcus sp. Q]
MPTKYALGFGHGRIVEFEDGTAAYYKTGELTQAFRIKIADVRGFSVTKGGKMLTRSISVLGNGTTLATVDVNHGTSELIENWFKGHPLFNTTATPTTPAAPAPHQVSPHLVADELRKLADMRNEGILTQAEFDAQKAKLLSR